MNVELTNKLVKLNQQELTQLSKGELSYVEHPIKGVVGVDMENVYVNTIELD